MTPKMKLGETQSLDELLAAIRAGVNPQELAARVKELTRPDGDRRLPVPWFRWCREAIKGSSGGVVAKGGHWLDLDDDDLLEPLRSVRGTLVWLDKYNVPLPWIEVALRLAKLARDVSDTVQDEATPEEDTGVTEIAKQLSLAGECAALWDLYCDYRGLSRPALAHCIALPLVDDSSPPQGVLGELRLALMPEGTGQLYRAHTMAFVKIEDDFRDAAATALAALAGMGLVLPAGRDLRWEVRMRATGAIPTLPLTGPSCGGAFALGMWVLLAGERADPRAGVLGPLRPEELSGIAITATIDAQGTLDPIGGEVHKLQAAAKEQVLPRIHTFVVHTDQQGLDTALETHHAELRLLRATTLTDALDQIFLDRAGRRPYLAVLSGFDHRRWLARDYPHLIGRTWLRERLARFLTDQESGYLLITAGPGVGKTAFLFHQIAAEPAPDAWHFIRQGQGDWDNPDCFLAVLDAQLRLRYGLLPAAESTTGSPGGRFLATLEAVAGRLDPGEHCLILLDGLDEAFGPTGRWPMEILPGLLSETLPRGIYIVLSSRPGEHLRWLADPRRVRRLHLDPADAELWGRQRDDLRQYIAWRAEAIRRDCGLELNSEFQGQLLAASEGLFIAAERFLSDRAELASDLRAWMADPGTLPRGLAGWLQRQWLRIEARARQDGQNPEMLRLLLGLLACAREPLTRAHLRTWRRAGTPSAPGVVEAPAEVGDEPLDEFVKARWDRLLGFAREWFGQDIADGRYRFMHTGFLEFCRERLDDTERRDLNQLLAYWAGGWRSQEGEIRSYALRYLPHHLREAGQWDALHEVLTDPAEYLPARIALGGEAGWPALMEDYQRTLTGWPRERPEQRREIEDVYRVLAQAGHRLWGGREPVIQVLYNGLTGIWGEGSPLGQRLRRAADAARRPWFRLLNPPREHSSLLRVLVWHQDEVTCLAFSPPDAQGPWRLATGHNDGMVRVWDLDRAAPPRVLEGHDRYITALAFSPPDAWGRCRLATGSEDGKVRIWDLESTSLLQVLEGQGDPIRTLAFSPPDALGRCRLATGSWDGSVRICDLDRTALPQVLEGQGDPIRTLAFSPPDASGRCRLATGSRDGAVRVWNLESASLPQVLEGQGDPIRTLAFSPPDALGRCRLATGSWDGSVRVWEDLESVAPSRLLEGYGYGPIRTLAFSPPDTRDRYQLATDSDDGTVQVWDLENAALLRVLEWPGYGRRSSTLAFSPRDTQGRCWLAAGSDDGTIRVCDLDSTAPPRVLEGQGGIVHTLAFSPRDAQGRCRLATGSRDDTVLVRIWDLESAALPQVLEGHSLPIETLAFSPPDAQGGYRLATGSDDRTIRVWDLESAAMLQVLEGYGYGRISILAFSPPDAQGRCRLVTGSWYGTVQVWELDSAAPPRVLEGHGYGRILTLAFSSPDAWGHCRLATGSEDGTVRIWDLDRVALPQVLMPRGQGGFIWTIAFSPPDASGRCRLATGSEDGKVRIWDLESASLLQVLEGQGDPIRTLAFSPPDASGRCRLATGSRDGAVRVWDLESAALPQVLEGQDGFIFTLAFSSPDAQGLCRLATGSDDDKYMGYSLMRWGYYLLGLDAVVKVQVRELAFDPKVRFLKVALAETLMVWDWERLPQPLSVGLTNLRSVWVDPADECRFIAVGVDETNHRPIFYHLRLENFPPPP